MRRTWIGPAIGLCLAACGGGDGGDFIVPGYEALVGRPAAATCTEEDLEDDGRVDEYTRLVEEDGGQTWLYEIRDGARALMVSSVMHFDAAGRFLGQRDEYPDGTSTDCAYVYDSFGRELSGGCDWDGDGVAEATHRVTEWTAAGQVAVRVQEDSGRTATGRMTYDPLGRLLGDEVRWDDDGAVRWKIDVVYDDTRRTRWSRWQSSSGGAEQTVTFDGRGRRLRVESTAAGGYVQDFVWRGDELEKLVRRYHDGTTSTTRYVGCE
jgi:hypothetical protein